MNPGQLVAERYLIRGMLGRGGMGEVYLAHDQRLATEVALKRVPLEQALETSVREALVSEARILARLSHTHIVRLFDLADTVDGIFLVLEYVCGASLDKLLRVRKTLSPQELIHVMDHVAEGLTLAHSRGVIHRDLKPSNLLVSFEGDERRRFLRDGSLPPDLLNSLIKVTDFGLAKVVEQITKVQASGSVAGTPPYMAPEQFRGELPSAETDVYALGLIAYECLTGSLPVGSVQPMYFHLFVTPPPLTGAVAHMNAAIQKALAKERTQRFRSAAEFADALRVPAIPSRKSEPVVDPPVPPVIPPAAPKRRKSTGLKVGAVAAAGLAVAVPLGLFLRGRPSSSSARSEAPERVVERVPDLQPLPPLNPAPRIDSLPPVVEGSRRPIGEETVWPRGISRPEILSHASVQGSQVLAFGPGGMVYVTSNSSDIGAVRDGQLRWLYRLAGDSARLWIAPDGLIWIWASQGDELFCFNVTGQGGELTQGLRKRLGLEGSRAGDAFYATPESPYSMRNSIRCMDPDAKRDEPTLQAGPVRGDAGWRVAIDQRCEQSPSVDRSGRVLVQTASRTLYSVSKQGQVQWLAPLPCKLDTLAGFADGAAAGLCSGPKRMLGVKDGQLKFDNKYENSISGSLLPDRDGNFYFLQSTSVYTEGTIVKMDGAGKELWTMPVPLVAGEKLELSPDGRLYLMNSAGGSSSLLMIGDRTQ